MLHVVFILAAGPFVPDPLPEGASVRFGTTRLRHGFMVNSLAFSPNGRFLASSGNGKGLCLWDLRSGEMLHHGSSRRFPSTHGIAYSPDGAIIAACEGTALHLYDTRTGKPVRELSGRDSSVVSAAWSPDGQWVAAGAYDQTVRLWRARDGKEGPVLKGFSDPPWGLAFRGDSRALATMDRSGELRLWEAHTGKLLWKAQAHMREAVAVSLAWSGDTLATCGRDGEVHIWSGDGKKQTTHRVPGGPLVVVAHSGRLAVGGLDGHITIIVGGKQRRLQSSTMPIRALAFSPDGKLLASGGSWRSRIEIWDTRAWKTLTPPSSHEGPIDVVRVVSGSREVLSIGRDRSLIRWGLDGRATALLTLPGRSARIHPSALSPDGAHAAIACSSDSYVIVCDARTGQPLRRLTSTHGQWISALSISHDGRVAMIDQEGMLCVWDIRTGRLLAEGKPHLPASSRILRAFTFSEDGKLLSTTWASGAVLIDSRTCKVAREQDFGQFGYASAISKDSQVAAFVGDNDFPGLVLWDTRTGDILRSWLSGQSGVYSAAFSPDGRLLATGGDEIDQRAALWEVATGRKVCSFSGQTGAVLSLAFLPCSRRLLTAGGESSILMWKPRGKGHSPEEAWKSLALEDAEKGVAAVWDLAESPGGPALIARRLRPLTPVSSREVARHLDGLDAESAEERSRAESEIEKLGPSAEPALRKALASLGLEPRRRVQRILRGWAESPESLRQRRAVWALEQAGTPEARKHLKALADGPANAWLTEEAKAALARLDR
jgi:WD40 repeat protein